MNENYVTDEIAFELKDIGFDKKCTRAIYTGNTALNENQYMECLPSAAKNFNAENMCISIPLWQQTVDWFAEKFNIAIDTVSEDCNEADSGETEIFEWRIRDWNNIKLYYSDIEYITRYEARKAAIIKATEIIKNRQ